MIRITVEHVKPGRKRGKRIVDATLMSVRGGVRFADGHGIDPETFGVLDENAATAVIDLATVVQGCIEAEYDIACGAVPEESPATPQEEP